MMMTVTQTERDFERMSWHDCHVWRIGFDVGDFEEDDWTTDLVIGIDYISEWLCGVDRSPLFKVAPADLVFHGVTDPKINIDWGDSKFQVAMHYVCIDRISREQVLGQKVYLDRPYYHWTISLNWPSGGEVSFGAVGYTQTLLAEPVLLDRQNLTLSERNRLISG